MNKLDKNSFGRFSNFTLGKKLPFQNWYPYLEGYSPDFVKKIVSNYFDAPQNILEPFAGVGTTPITLKEMNINCSYCEMNPFLVNLIKAKNLVLSDSLNNDILNLLIEINENLIGNIDHLNEDTNLKNSYEKTFVNSLYFSNENYSKILKLKSFENNLNPTIKPIFELAVASILVDSSRLKRQGDLRFKTPKEINKETVPIEILLRKKITNFINDINLNNQFRNNAEIKFLTHNSKDLILHNNLNFDGVITSPPYLNGTNYIRNTKLELWYLGLLNSKKDLRDLRNQMVTAGINDVNKFHGSEIILEVEDIYNKISKAAYDARIPKMVAQYFFDMKIVMEGISNNVKKGGIVCIDIGDSIYSDTHIPTHNILKDIAKNFSLKITDEVILRKRKSNNGNELSQRLLVFKNEL